MKLVNVILSSTLCPKCFHFRENTNTYGHFWKIAKRQVFSVRSGHPFLSDFSRKGDYTLRVLASIRHWKEAYMSEYSKEFSCTDIAYRFIIIQNTSQVQCYFWLLWLCMSFRGKNALTPWVLGSNWKQTAFDVVRKRSMLIWVFGQRAHLVSDWRIWKTEKLYRCGDVGAILWINSQGYK